MNQSHSFASRAMELDIDPRGFQLFVVQVIFLVFVWIFIFLRALVKLFVLKRVTLDDFFMFISVVRESPCK